jgi:hypothetical protein
MSWFCRLFGFPEEGQSGEEIRKRIRISRIADNGDLLFLESVGEPYHSRYCVGRFEHKSLKDLRRDVPPERHAAPSTVKLVYGDVQAYLADPANRGAVFQVASQFNCLEFVSPSEVPENGVTKYFYDRTQGPACCLSTGPATVYRNYFLSLQRQGKSVILRPDGAEGHVTGQLEYLQLNGADDLENIIRNEQHGYFRVKNGYLMSDTDGLTRFSRAAKEFPADVGDCLKVGIHRDVQVTAQNWGSKLVDDPCQTVTLCFGSACAVNYSPDNNRDLWEPLARLILNASYEAALWVGAANQKSNTVFLTFLGGGVFGNDEKWIASAIRRAANRVPGLDIRIISYTKLRPATEAMFTVGTSSSSGCTS